MAKVRAREFILALLKLEPHLSLLEVADKGAQ
jgi:hypothetical protein